MNADELRATQAPIKQRYRDDPAAALIPARAEAVLEHDVACTVRPGRRHPCRAARRRRAASSPAPPTCCWRRWSPAPASR